MGPMKRAPGTSRFGEEQRCREGLRLPATLPGFRACGRGQLRTQPQFDLSVVEALCATLTDASAQATPGLSSPATRDITSHRSGRRWLLEAGVFQWPTRATSPDQAPCGDSCC
jgi:hypothetical protein